MCLVKYHVLLLLLLCLITLECYALNCRSDGGPKEAELKNIYKKCLKMQDSKNMSRSNSEQDYRDRGQIRHDWDRGRGNKDGRNRDDTDRRDRMDTGMRNRDNMGMNDERGRRNDRMGNDGMENGRIGISDGMGRRNEMNGRHDMQGRESKYGRDDYHGGRDGFSQNEDFDSEMPYNNYHSSTQMPRRYRRDKRPENSGQRSQYNPNIQKITGYHDSFRSDEKNSSENNSNRDGDKKACALHCFLENLEMTAEDGMPDRYLVTHAITKDVKNEDLRDFLQESIEECFQILDNESTEDKCEFSKNLLMCLSEKGRSNCDDWRDDLRF